ncbi:Gfo/Idh/MocA family protein [Paenibacillus allorhizosphaerae]|uniref:Inositol 2-dehydrogenase/D-chiro-inositol 3-dehydrogenase n=1 Tax=Paenibacillus allorhizosphaerae TaxID=2849866 RepID=A0ABM8VB86_9BACL|nr:Gfo/Idh/MocA family oxidoreductase [Paenibacillus allorhizosphaerae]CAG7618741.1 Inositol 2-dehydrogenase/D-chiro-inositol 3-dehydrogenase [Paenibacillus allorhizosphaerae]
MENEKYPFGILECRHGHIAMFIEEMMALGHPCVGIWEPEQPQLAKTLSSKFGVPLLEEEAPLWESAVRVIGTSAVNNRKIGIIERCEQHGKHVMADKPAVTDRAQLKRLEAIVRRGRIQVGMLLTERFRPSILKLKSEIDEGRLGRIASITMRKPHRLAPKTREAWHFHKEQNGGIIIDLFIHDVDLVRYLTGQDIASQHSVMTKLGQPEHPDFYDAAGMQLLLSGGTMAQLYADWHTPDQSWTWGDLRIFVTGTEGTAELRLNGDPAVVKEELYFQVTNGAPFARVEPDVPAQQASITGDFLRRLAGGQSALTHYDLLAASEAVIKADEQAELFGLEQSHKS